jgi:hypothetical protein
MRATAPGCEVGLRRRLLDGGNTAQALRKLWQIHGLLQASASVQTCRRHERGIL